MISAVFLTTKTQRPEVSQRVIVLKSCNGLTANLFGLQLIYTASKAMKLKISWTKVTTDSEWTYFGDGIKVSKDIVTNMINNHFTDTLLYISWTRQNSFEVEKGNIEKVIEELLGKEDFFIWDTKFKRAIEFNHIGVMGRGQVSS